MTINGKTASIPDVYTFSDIVDETCDKLMDKHIKYSIRRIMEMEEYLTGMEKELDAFLGKAAFPVRSDFQSSEVS